MSMELKFRAWDKRHKDMEYINDLYWFEEHGIHNLDGNSFCTEYDIMPFSGIHDKNGKEIYEGDLLNMHYLNESVVKGKVVTVKMGMTYDSDGWKHGRTYGWVAGNNSLADVAPYAEVLGNIYENPELLEEED